MYLKINQQKITSAELALVVKSLHNGEVIVYPTDTIYGLGCLASNAKAINKIKKIKQREISKPFIILVSSLYMAKKYCFISKKQEVILKELWSSKRPTSVILRHRNLLPKELIPKQEGIAVRLPKSDFLRKMIRTAGTPIVSTSFNISGESVYNQVAFLADKKLTKTDPDLIIDGGVLNNKPSKIIDLTTEQIKIIRK
jgi:L-threonylcarbamoyladenylate synthase